MAVQFSVYIFCTHTINIHKGNGMKGFLLGTLQG